MSIKFNPADMTIKLDYILTKLYLRYLHFIHILKSGQNGFEY